MKLASLFNRTNRIRAVTHATRIKRKSFGKFQELNCKENEEVLEKQSWKSRDKKNMDRSSSREPHHYVEQRKAVVDLMPTITPRNIAEYVYCLDS